MKDGGSVKISLSLPARLVARIDRAAKSRPDGNRSRVVAEWLEEAAATRADRELEREVVAYYESRDTADVAEDEAIGAGASRAARRMLVDGAKPRRTR